MAGSPLRYSSVGVGLRREAAHNLAQIYKMSGSPELGQDLYRQYCQV
jgi:hypothetical protein